MGCLISSSSLKNAIEVTEVTDSRDSGVLSGFNEVWPARQMRLITVDCSRTLLGVLLLDDFLFSGRRQSLTQPGWATQEISGWL